MNKKIKLLILIIPLVLVLTGCTQVSTESSGIWNFLVISLAKMIVFFANIFGNSLGWGIIIMTLIIRLIMFPLYGNQIKSSDRMRAIQPKINKLNQKYEGKKDSDSQRKKAMEQQAIYKESGINPLAGCLPLLVQFPLIIAFYQAIEYLVPPQATIDQLEKSGQTVIIGLQQLGAQDLSTVIFGFELGESVIIFALIAAITTYFTSYVSMIGQDTNSPGMGAMRGMMYVMPIMIFIFGLKLPGALSIYWVVGNIFAIAQTLYLKRSTIQTERQKKKLLKENR